MKRPIKRQSLETRINRQILLSSDKTCFVISPIGKQGTAIHRKFRDVLDYVIKPAVKKSGYQLEVIRADDIERAGSFIKDIFEYLLNSYVVVADLTGQNPNVFYELGVRHSLGPRTILIAQSIDDIPSDLREYRTIVYETSAKGAAEFEARLAKYLEEIFTEPIRSDNPVLDRLPRVLEAHRIELERENMELKKQIEAIAKRGKPVSKLERGDLVKTRARRIFTLIGAESCSFEPFGGSFTRKTKGGLERYELPTEQGNFELYFLTKRDSIPKSVYSGVTPAELSSSLGYPFTSQGHSILGAVYFSVIDSDVDYTRELADIRVLMEDCSQDQNMPCKFVIVTNKDLENIKSKINKTFDKMKSFIKGDKRELFKIEIWDKTGLLKREKELGIKIDI